MAAVSALVALALTPTVAVEPGPPGPNQETDPGQGQERGTWNVEKVAEQSFEVRWRAPEPLPITDDRPEMLLDGTPIAAPELSGDGRTLSATVGLPEAPEVDELAVELSGQVLDSTGQPTAEAGAPYEPPALGPPPPVDPGEPGGFTVVREDYELPDLKLPGMPAAVEVVGHVQRPAEAGGSPRPLVLFLHGRHQPCYESDQPSGSGSADWPCPRGTSPVPSHLGYRYLQKLLARQGYVTVSIAANGINAQDWRLLDGGATARAALVRAHLRQWASWAAGGQYDVDMDQVMLIGHSRGGEGVNRASIDTPLSAPYTIAGQVLIAPTDFGRQAAGYVPTVTVLPYCDGDVYDLQGQGYTDTARDLSAGDSALRSSVMVMGANHNFFNTEWTPRISVAPSFDDGAYLPAPCERGTDTRLTGAEQRKVAKAYVAGAVGLLAERNDRLLPVFDGSDVDVPSAGGADVRTHMVGGGRELRAAGVGATLGTTSGASARFCVGKAAYDRPSFCGDGLDSGQSPHWIASGYLYPRGVPSQRSWEVSWSAADGEAALDLSAPLDLSTSSGLDLRTVVDPALGRVRLDVRLEDGAGGAAIVGPENGGLLRPMPGHPSFTKYWAQPLRVGLSGVTGVDLGDVRRIAVVGRSGDGRVWVLDASGSRSRLPAVPQVRLPRINLRGASVLEGDQRTEQIAEVPFEVLGEVREPSSFVATSVSWDARMSIPPQVVALSAGQTGGVIRVPYLPDTRDDLAVQRIQIGAYAKYAAMPSKYGSILKLLDDDPTPRMTLRRESAMVREGGVARWVVSLSAPTDYYTYARGRIVRSARPLPALRVGDVRRAWLRERTWPLPAADTPLHRAEVWLGALIRPGRSSGFVTIPIRRDTRAEGGESVALRVRAPQMGVTEPRTVVVRDR